MAVWAPLAEPAQHALIIGKPRTPIKPNDLYDHHATIPRKMRFMAGQLCANRRWRGPALERAQQHRVCGPLLIDVVPYGSTYCPG